MYSFLCHNHFLKLLCCSLELCFLERTDSEHAAMSVHCSVTGTAVSPPLTCSSGCFYKQKKSEWVSVVKKIPKKNMTLNIMPLMAFRSYLKINGRLFPTQPTQTFECGYCQLLQCFTCEHVQNGFKRRKIFLAFFFLIFIQLHSFSTESAVQEYKCLMCKHGNTMNSLKANIIT